MGSRTTFSLYSYSNNDVNNLVYLIPSIKWKYFYPQDLKDSIIDSKTFDLQKAFKETSGWEGDPLMNYSSDYLPTIVLLEGGYSDKGSFIFLFLKKQKQIAIRCFTFDEFKGSNLSKIEEDLRKEIEDIQSEESKKVIEVYSAVVEEILSYERKS